MSNYSISTDNSKINLEKLHIYLSKKSYWSKNIPYDILSSAVDNSMNFSVLTKDDLFVGFARLVTDKATFAYLADVYIEDEYQGIGLGKLLLDYIMSHPDVKKIRTWLLLTKDAQDFYKQYGWKHFEDSNFVMKISHKAEEFYKNLKVSDQK